MTTFQEPSSHHLQLAIRALENEGLQLPSYQMLEYILHLGVLASGCFMQAAVKKPTSTDIDEFFADFVVRSVNTPPGINDASSN